MSNREEFEKIEVVKNILSDYAWFFDSDSNQYVLESYIGNFECLKDSGCLALTSCHLGGLWHVWQARVPEGYVVVPKEPTCEMVEAAIGNNGHIESIYRDMIEATEK